MLILNQEKEKELVEKYGFEKKEAVGGGNFYDFGRSLTIYGLNYGNPRYNLTVKMHTGSKDMQDVLFDLIKNDVLIKVEDSKKEKKKSELKLRIEELKKQIKELENGN